MQNEPKFPRFQPKNHDFPQKRTQNEPKTNPNKAKFIAAKRSEDGLIPFGQSGLSCLQLQFEYRVSSIEDQKE